MVLLGSSAATCALIFFRISALYKSFSYLLSYRSAWFFPTLQEINIYRSWLYCRVKWYVELKTDVRCTQLCGFYLLSFFSWPNLSGRRLDVYHTSAHGVPSPGAGGCRSGPHLTQYGIELAKANRRALQNGISIQPNCLSTDHECDRHTRRTDGRIFL